MNRHRLVILITTLLLFGTLGYGQVKDLPSQAELDPILENLNTKLKDFAATLTDFKPEATTLDRDRLTEDLESIKRLQEMVRVTHSGRQGNQNGLNMRRLVGLLSGVDDMAIEASIWKNLAELKMSMEVISHRDPQRYSAFAVRLNTNLQLLREVGAQLFHPTFRLAVAADEVISTVADRASQQK